MTSARHVTFWLLEADFFIIDRDLICIFVSLVISFFCVAAVYGKIWFYFRGLFIFRGRNIFFSMPDLIQGFSQGLMAP
jgi:hypothetical protein